MWRVHIYNIHRLDWICYCLSSSLSLISFSISQGVGTRFKRETPPSKYFVKSTDGEVKLVLSNDPSSTKKNGDSIPLFSASELAPTYHDGGINRILGCPHYARSCEMYISTAVYLKPILIWPRSFANRQTSSPNFWKAIHMSSLLRTKSWNVHSRQRLTIGSIWSQRNSMHEVQRTSTSFW